MEQGSKTKKNILLLIGILVIILIIDRYFWAQISQWREDQATNIWLGYMANFTHIPVGLISSRDVPNPNGMVILGYFLSRLPNLLSISFFLGFVQIIFVALVAWKSFGKDWHYFLLAALPPLTSVILRSISVEFWNQYTITLVNILFIFWAIRYLENTSLWNMVPITVLILLAPSLYLAGIVNAMVMTAITLGIILFRKPKLASIRPVFLSVLAIMLLSLFLTWLPYFQTVGFDQLSNIKKGTQGPFIFMKTFWESVFGLPLYVTFQWADKLSFANAFMHADEKILSLTTKVFLRMVGRIYLLQAIFAFSIFIYKILDALKKGISGGFSNLKINRTSAILVILSGLFISLSFTFSTWMGGPNWLHGERPDQIVQFLPMFLFLIFLLPVTITDSGRVQKIITRASYTLLFLFITINLFSGFMIIRDHLEYRGNILTGADVPLIDKMRLVDFIAEDWKQVSESSIVPVDYDLGGQWDWVPEFGLKLTEWYPSPMTTGRSFDYEFLRRFGLKNQQEGTQLREFGNNRYLVTYAFEDPPQVKEGLVTNYIFGRLRVTIVDRNLSK